MLRYWTTWNFIWWSYTEIMKKKISIPLKTSIISTSFLGAGFTYIYPRRVKLRCFNYSWNIPRHYHILADAIVHHLPLYRAITTNIDMSICGIYTTIPAMLYMYYNKFRGINPDKTYGINYDIACGLCFSSVLIQGLYYHKFVKKNLSRICF